MEQLLSRISQRWFLAEPAFFALYCRQRVEANPAMQCAVRSGRGAIEYSPRLLRRMSERQVEQLLRIELIRIFLGHPYQRQPDHVGAASMALASDVTIAEGYADPTGAGETLPLPTCQTFGLPADRHYEWYARQLEQMFPSRATPASATPLRSGHAPVVGDADASTDPTPTPGTDPAPEPDGPDTAATPPSEPLTAEASQPGPGAPPKRPLSKARRPEAPRAGSRQASARHDAPADETPADQPATTAARLAQAADKAATWEEDALRRCETCDIIRSMTRWGSIPGSLVSQIVASTRARIDYRLVMQGFRGAILAQQAALTRMRPNRRTGFDQMGTKRRFTTRLLVAVDVSGSIDDRSLAAFYGVVGRLFRYGMAQIDTVQFDCALGPVRPMRRAPRHVEVVGRGGTSFQPVFDYVAAHNVYDGLLLLTDGYARHPDIDRRIKAKILWVCEDERAYAAHHHWMSLTGRVCTMAF